MGSKIFLRTAGSALFLALSFLVTSGTASADAPYHSIEFVENASSTDPVFATQTANQQTSLTLFTNLQPSFSNSSKSFFGWNTSQDGSGTSYSDGGTYSFSSSIILYAIWTNNFHTVEFAENDSLTDQVFCTQTSNSPEQLTLFAHILPVFVNQGFRFTGWNTAQNGSGTSYTDGEQYSFVTSVTLYAQWSQIPSDSINFDPNGGTGSVATLTGASGSSISLPAGSNISRLGYVFEGWNAQSNGQGMSYSAGATFTIASTETLYAQWQPTSYTVSFVGNGGVAAVGAMTYTTTGSPLTLPQASEANMMFTGWFTQPSGGTLAGQSGATFVPSQSQTLYAQWSNIPDVTVSYNLNGGTGSLASVTNPVGTVVTLPLATAALYVGHVLTSWNTQANGQGELYQPGQSVTLEASLSLYAQWGSVATTRLWGSITPFVNTSSVLTATMQHQIAQLVAAVKSNGASLVTLEGFAASTSSASFALSAKRASVVANYFRQQLSKANLGGVTVVSTGERTLSRTGMVEVFLR